MNKVILVGRLTRDPEVKNTMTGRAVATFTLAVDRRFKNKDGQKEADFIPIVFWGKTGRTGRSIFIKRQSDRCVRQNTSQKLRCTGWHKAICDRSRWR